VIVELWAQVTGFLLNLVDSADHQIVFLLILVEEAGLPFPMPGDLIKVLAGYRVAQGKASLLGTLAVLEGATVLGASILYWIGARGGRPLLYRCAPVFRCDRQKLERAEAWITRHGVVAIVLSRVIPGLRIPSALMAGAFGMPYLKFLPALALGSMLYILFFVLLGMWGGPRAFSMLGQLELSLRAIVTLVLFVGLTVLIGALYRQAARVPAEHVSKPLPLFRRLETALLAGFLATVEVLLTVNVLLYALGWLGVNRPEWALMQLVDRGAPLYSEGDVTRFFLHLTFVVVLANAACALVYGLAVREAPLDGAWLRGLAFAPLPLSISLLGLIPYLGAGPLGADLGAGLLPIAGEVLRNLLFGVALAITYALLCAARQRPLTAAALVGSP
jgi:membrane protein DedA with SNARE-associated domain